MVFKPTYVRRKCCLPLYILCVELFSEQTIIERVPKYYINRPIYTRDRNKLLF